MLSAVSGGEVIQDVPNILDDNYGHPNPKLTPDS